MKRRNFIKKIGLAGAGTFIVPYILPSGRLFAASGTRKANHVVFCMFAGGVRNLESVHKADGNLMRNTLNGNESISTDILPGMTNLPAPTSTPLQNYGTLFKEFRYNNGPTGHFNGHTVAITGAYTTTDLNLKERPANPTVFEYYRKHNSPSTTALNSWWISDTLGPYPALNYSKDLNYGPLYGGNYIQPLSIINYNSNNNSFNGYDLLGTPRMFSAAEANSNVKLKLLLDNNFKTSGISSLDAGPTNNQIDREKLNIFLNTLLNEAKIGVYNNPWGISTPMNSDMYNIFFTEKVIKEFKPELTVVNMQGIDIGHSNFTQYCDNIRKADFALWHLWQTIQSTPGMANDTVLIVAPEIGRNASPNSIIDNFGRYALDHTSDQSSREIFCLIAGPNNIVKQGAVITSETGESIDIVPTICEILGYYQDIPLSYRNRMGSTLNEAFV